MAITEREEARSILNPSVLTGRDPCYPQWHWLEYDPVALAVLVLGIGLFELPFELLRERLTNRCWHRHS